MFRGSPLKQAKIDPLQRLREALVQRYAFERGLGGGGMATVYFVRDLRHDRPVALKLLHHPRFQKLVESTS
jgi:serine/threonine protein kinase